MSPAQTRAVEVVMAGFGRPHNWCLSRSGIELLEHGVRVGFTPGVSVSSFDTDGLTRMVVEAHRVAVRVELVCREIERVDDDDAVDDSEGDRWDEWAGVSGELSVLATVRDRTGDLYSRHPSIEEALSGGG